MIWVKALCILCTVTVGAIQGFPSEDRSLERILASLSNPHEIPGNVVPLGLSVPELVRAAGYPIEVHNVTTADGYILEVHRIPYGKKCGAAQGKKVIFLQHGLLCDSSNWIEYGVEKAFAYLLADSCYDVWMGNARGNTYSKRHVILDPTQDKEAFWSFSWNEMGIYDLPAYFDYVLGKTGQEKLFYAGHSMGTTMFWICMTERPEYNDKIRLMSALAPVAYTEHMISPIRLIAPFSSQVEWLLEMFGMYEFLPSSKFMDFIGQTFCRENSLIQPICSNVLFLLCGFDQDQLDPALIPDILSHLPAGSSVQSVVHYAQGVTSQTFQKFDYGKQKNQEIYGQDSPPVYDWSKISAPVALYWGQNDWLGAAADTHRISEDLPNIQRKFRINHDKFNHLDFLFAKDVKPLVYEPAMEFMEYF